jgi:hypothetical protein
MTGLEQLQALVAALQEQAAILRQPCPDAAAVERLRTAYAVAEKNFDEIYSAVDQVQNALIDVELDLDDYHDEDEAEDEDES